MDRPKGSVPLQETVADCGVSQADAGRKIMRVTANVFGVINDAKFTCVGNGHIDVATGDAEITLTYSHCPPDWNILNYSDPLVLLGGYKEEAGGLHMMSLSKGEYHAEATIDFGRGLLLRKTASVRAQGDALMASYSLFGTARVADIASIEPYEEYMIPAGDGQMIAIGLAKWKTTDGKMIQAVQSTRYFFDEPAAVLKQAQVRRFEAHASVDKSGLEYRGRYKTSVRAM
jgi:hypothetical protein